MALLCVASSGSNTAPYETKAKAATSLATALAAATAGDVVVIQYDEVPSVNKEQAADTTYTVPVGVALISGDITGSSWVYRPMSDDSDWIGNSTTNRSITFITGAIAGSVYLAGLRLRTAGAVSDSIRFFSTSGYGQLAANDLFFDIRNTNAGARLVFGSTTANHIAYALLTNPRFRFGNSGQYIDVSSATAIQIIGGYIDSAGSVPDNLFGSSTQASGQAIEVVGFDASVMASGSTLVGNLFGVANPTVTLRQVRRGAGCAVLAAPTTVSRPGVEVYEYDCQEGTNLNVYGYHNAFGSVVLDASVYLTAEGAGNSIRIDTTANCSAILPFQTPWTDWDNQDVTTSVTPRREVLRKDSTTAFTDAEVYADFSVLVTSGSVVPTVVSDGVVVGASGTAQPTGAGTGAWTNPGGTAWSGKLETPTALTPIAGRLRSRITVTVPSQTLYACTNILT